MEDGLGSLQRDLGTIKNSYATDRLTLSVTVKYVAHLLANGRVLQCLAKHHAERLREVQLSTHEWTERVVPDRTSGKCRNFSRLGLSSDKRQLSEVKILDRDVCRLINPTECKSVP